MNKLANGQFDMLMHLGDFAYNVESNAGEKGDDFFRKMSPISARIPYIIVPGNHEMFDNSNFFNFRF
jgi:acid phosphatase type 7